jgi:hypothetical protein
MHDTKGHCMAQKAHSIQYVYVKEHNADAAYLAHMQCMSQGHNMPFAQTACLVVHVGKA